MDVLGEHGQKSQSMQQGPLLQEEGKKEEEEEKKAEIQPSNQGLNQPHD